MKDLLIEDAWRSFERAVLTPSAPAIQRTEMRRAFYAGAQALFTGILSMLDPGADATEADLGKMDAIQAELLAFAQSVRDGRA